MLQLTIKIIPEKHHSSVADPTTNDVDICLNVKKKEREREREREREGTPVRYGRI